MSQRKCIAALAVVLSVVAAGWANAPATLPVQEPAASEPGLAIAVTYDLLLGQPVVRVHPSETGGQFSMTVGCPTLDPVLRQFLRVFLAASPALAAPEQEDAAEEAEAPPERERTRGTNSERRLPAPSASEREYRNMLRSTEQLELAPHQPPYDEGKLSRLPRSRIVALNVDDETGEYEAITVWPTVPPPTSLPCDEAKLPAAARPKIVVLDPDDENAEYKDILVNVKETRSGGLMFGAGVNGDRRSIEQASSDEAKLPDAARPQIVVLDPDTENAENKVPKTALTNLAPPPTDEYTIVQPAYQNPSGTFGEHIEPGILPRVIQIEDCDFEDTLAVDRRERWGFFDSGFSVMMGAVKEAEVVIHRRRVAPRAEFPQPFTGVSLTTLRILPANAPAAPKTAPDVLPAGFSAEFRILPGGGRAAGEAFPESGGGLGER